MRAVSWETSVGALLVKGKRGPVILFLREKEQPDRT
jgi:hypothetical protein